MPCFRIAKRKSLWAYQAKPVQGLKHNVSSCFRTAAVEWSEPAKQGEIDTLRPETREYTVEKVSDLVQSSILIY